MDHEDLIKRLRKDMFTLKPASEFRKEILACMDDKTIADKSEAIRNIMDRYGYDKLTLEDFNRIFHFKAPGEVIKPHPADPPVTKPTDDKDPFVFNLSGFAAVYRVTSTNPPCRELSIKEVSPGQQNEVTFISGKGEIVFKPKLELDPATQEEWVTWSDGPTAYKVEFYSQFDKAAEKLSRRFRGWMTKSGQKSLEFDGEEESPDKDRGPSFWKKYGFHCALGGIVFFALGTYMFLKYREAAEKKKDVARQQEALDMQKATLAQSNAHVAETRAMAEAEAAESFMESTSSARRGALIESIDAGFHKAFEDFKQDLDVSRKDGNLKFEFANQDKALRETFDTIVKEKISTFVTANPKVPGSQILQALVDQGLYKAEDKQAREKRISAEAISNVTLSMLGDYGSYKDMIDSNIERMRVEYNLGILNNGITSLEGEIHALSISVTTLGQNITNLEQKLKDATMMYENFHPGLGDPTLPAYDKKWLDEKEAIENDIADRTLERDAKNNERLDAEAKKKDAADKSAKAKQDREDAEKKKKDRETHFKDHMKLAH